MTEHIIIILLSILSGSAITIVSVLLGAWVMHKGGKHNHGESFVGSPKGEVFSVPFPDDMPEEPAEVAGKKIVERTTEFLKTLGAK